MTHSAQHKLHNRVLKFNVGFLLVDGPAHNHEFTLDLPTVQVAPDLVLAYIHGPVRFSRTKEGILVQAQFDTALDAECSRCLTMFEHGFAVQLEELYAYQSEAETEFRIEMDAILDLAPLLRDEVLISTTGPLVCRDDCKGLCPHCGANLNEGDCGCERDDIDPRMAVLKKLLDSQ